MFSAMGQRRSRLVKAVQDYVHQFEIRQFDKSKDETKLVSLMMDWLEIRDDKSEKPTQLFDSMKPLFNKLLPETDYSSATQSLLSKIWSERDMFPKISQWICGGDGWA